MFFSSVFFYIEQGTCHRGGRSAAYAILPFLKQNSEQVSVGGRGAGQGAGPSRRQPQFPHGGRRLEGSWLSSPSRLCPRTMPTGGRRERAGKPEVEMGQPDGKRRNTGQRRAAAA